MNDHQLLGYRLEQAAFNAWLPAQTILHNGWVVRLDSGYTGRANSVTPQGVAVPPFENQVASCEALYRERGLSPMFRLTTLEDYSGLDAFLEECGYTHTSATTVMVAPCEGVSTPHLHHLPLDEWLPYYDAHSERVNTEAHRAILERIATPHLYASLQIDGSIVAVGLGVVADDLFGLFDIVVAKESRGRGYGKQLVNGMLAWGNTNGAHTAYLQVTGQNTIAQRLYKQLGFSEAYYYHYRR
jgi:ribosomal protein S18 acetylase RimI-like enzyme